MFTIAVVAISLPVIVYAVIRSRRKWKTLLYSLWAIVTVYSIFMLVALNVRPAYSKPLGAVCVDLALVSAMLLSLIHARYTRIPPSLLTR
jgi:hypothetical protein